MSGSRPAETIDDMRMHASKTKRSLRAMGSAVRGTPQDNVRKRALALCDFMLETSSVHKAKQAKYELKQLLPSCVGLNRVGLRFRSVLRSNNGR